MKPGFPGRPGPVAVISLAQLFGTSLWFSANAVTPELVQLWQLSAAGIGWMTAAVQGGFILGTLVLAFSGLADRIRAEHLFALSALLGALLNAGFALVATGPGSGLLLRFLTGMSLAGIYPVGMKLMVQRAPAQAGWGLSVLVAMLTLGTALPQGLRALPGGFAWQTVILAASGLAVLAALLVLRGLPPAQAPASAPARAPRVAEMPGALAAAFRIPAFRRGALGYFGHMWELYAFWALVPLLLSLRLGQGAGAAPGVEGIAALSFAVIAIGAAGCLAGGRLARRSGAEAVARGALLLSGLCCLVTGLAGELLPLWLLLAVFLVWGATVVADSPQFSALCATSCPPELVGSALAMMNAVGFAITMVSIALTSSLAEGMGLRVALLLAPGPLLALLALHRRRAP